MYTKKVKENLDEELAKLAKKDPVLVQRVDKKIDEILLNPYHYKPLRNDLKNKRRVQIGCYVLVFQIIEEEKVVEFLRFNHHDDVYV
ncbi:MAG: type II toxin-antitoxin system RelE/ParE family toxin [Nanoarchaeota archaeon]|nr:type II toxin-antitoxin system RelE/ParE family toxin [Nanoarchaeota archaeon]MBU1321286.1 type II toxin-antitoxin system RelE/ParE family toxin [Nanoarchaeota archaeon]MBU1597116.1 type II toxin-antitoxin system RelE/ParE family toxin [Nanoarchaeota archaeon]MBU2442141.1 type II toxin-antitoxin system RelE/ParE family toxin [Nanoarchaeota archaeon]